MPFKNKDKSKEYHRQYLNDWKKKNPKKYKEYWKKYVVNNKEKISERNSNYWINIKKNRPAKICLNCKREFIGRLNQEYCSSKCRDCQRFIRRKNDPVYKKAQSIRDKNFSKKSYENNIDFRLKKLIRHRILEVLNRQLKGGKTEKSIYYGIDIFKIVEHLKKQLPDDFASGEYDIHHISDLVKFNLNNQEELKKAFAPENHTIILRKEHSKHHSNNQRNK